MTNPSPPNSGQGPASGGGAGPGRAPGTAPRPPHPHGAPQGAPYPGGPYGAGGPPRPVPREKGIFGALLDTRFEHLVTPKLIRLWYVIALLLITLQCVSFLFLGLWIASWDNGWAWGVIMVIASPLVWLFEALMVRILMEAVVVRFKGVEHLRVIKDKI